VAATTPAERISAGQRQSWARDPGGRRLAVALGHVRSVLRDHPEALPAVLAAAVEATAAAHNKDSAK